MGLNSCIVDRATHGTSEHVKASFDYIMEERLYNMRSFKKHMAYDQFLRKPNNDKACMGGLDDVSHLRKGNVPV